MRFSRSIICLKGRYLAETASSLVSPMTCVILNIKSSPQPPCKFHCGKRICTVAVSDELEIFWKLCKTPEGHAYGKDAGAGTAIVRYLATDDGTGCGVHDEPDKGFDAAYFDVGFIGCKDLPLFAGITVSEGFDTDGSGLAVAGDLLVRDADIIQISEGLRSFSEGESKIDMKGKAQGHDM